MSASLPATSRDRRDDNISIALAAGSETWRGTAVPRRDGDGGSYPGGRRRGARCASRSNMQVVRQTEIVAADVVVHASLDVFAGEDGPAAPWHH